MTMEIRPLPHPPKGNKYVNKIKVFHRSFKCPDVQSFSTEKKHKKYSFVKISPLSHVLWTFMTVKFSLNFDASLYEFAVQCKDVGACTQTKNEHWCQEGHFLRAYVKWRLFRCLWETFKVCQHSVCFLFSLIFRDSVHVALLGFLAVDKFNCKSGFDKCHVIPESIKHTDVLVWKNSIKSLKNPY